jgi:Cysteine-rich secretory protein family
MQHDSCRSTADYKFAGQNLAYRSSTGSFEPLSDVIEMIVEDWFKEAENAAQSDIDECCKAKSGKVIGHFTQLVSDRATQVGCAISQYTDKQWKTSLVACNYAITNMIGSKVYASGKTASGCISGTNPNFPALCAVKEPIEAKP